MKKLSKIDLIVDIKNLDTIIKFMTKENFYDKIVKFYSITSKLHDHVEEIQKLPLRGKVFLGIKTKERKMAEKGMSEFIAVIKKYSRGCSCNRSKKGQPVTKDDIYLDAGIDWFPISILEIDNRYSEYLDIDAYITEIKAINLNLDWIA
jgi:hypothetical protein